MRDNVTSFPSRGLGKSTVDLVVRGRRVIEDMQNYLERLIDKIGYSYAEGSIEYRMSRDEHRAFITTLNYMHPPVSGVVIPSDNIIYLGFKIKVIE